MFEKLKSEMARQGISTYKLAQMTGIASNVLYHYLKYGPLFPMYRHKISDALNVAETSLFTPIERGERDISKRGGNIND